MAPREFFLAKPENLRYNTLEIEVIIIIYLTGDTHGSPDDTQGFGKIVNFIREHEIDDDSIFIILGDAGLNYYAENGPKMLGYDRDRYLKEIVSKRIKYDIFCIHGNHERRPGTMVKYDKCGNIANNADMMYHLEEYHGGYVYVEDDFPNIKFAIDGQVYDFDGKKCLVIGGAYSVDKFYRLFREKESGIKSWFEDEQPSDETKKDIELALAEMGNSVDVILSHTVPYDAMPVEDFLSGIDQSTVDNSTEQWLQQIYDKNTIGKWYAGHYHCDKQKLGNITILYKSIIEL